MSIKINCDYSPDDILHINTEIGENIGLVFFTIHTVDDKECAEVALKREDVKRIVVELQNFLGE